MIPDSPIIELVNNILNKAIGLHASDIHLESTQQELRVRLRIDGFLYAEPIVNKEISLQVLSRIKILANMNIAERRIPQDGKFSYKTPNGVVDLRVATFPNTYGEKIVIRILDQQHTVYNIETLGFSHDILEQLKKIASKSQGFFLVTGPTGSGKTTTLHALLSCMTSPEKHIVTLEDPIEYYRDDITQGQIYPEIGFTFQKGIRSLLRLDPDIIMLGEIRDQETAHVAIQAALTGHLLLSTLHTNDTVGALMRLLDLKIEPFLLNAAVTGILAQRLARKLCLDCRYEAPLESADKVLIKSLAIRQKIDKLYKSTGCPTCRFTGYKSRTGIFELLTLSASLRELIGQKPLIDTIYNYTKTDGLVTLLDDATDKITQGITSLEEIYRILS